MLELKQFDCENKEILKKEWEYISNLPADENGFTNNSNGISYEDFITSYVPKRKDFAEGKNLKEGLVPQIDFLLWENNEIIGMFRVRPQLNDFLRTVTGGHIGYGIIKKARGKGYATKGLALALKELKKRTADKEAYLFCHKDNPASLHVMQKNGAYIHHETEENICTRIKL